MKNARRQARESALQALYAWQLSGADPREQPQALEGAEPGDAALLQAILTGVRERAAELEALITPHLDRDFARLSPVERAILYLDALELAAHRQTPFKVVLNEAIELGKSFGAAEGHRFVNGVLEKIASQVRPEEVAEFRRKVGRNIA